MGSGRLASSDAYDGAQRVSDPGSLSYATFRFHHSEKYRFIEAKCVYPPQNPPQLGPGASAPKSCIGEVKASPSCRLMGCSNFRAILEGVYFKTIKIIEIAERLTALPITIP